MLNSKGKVLPSNGETKKLPWDRTSWMIWLQSTNRSAAGLLQSKQQTSWCFHQKPSPEESHCKGRQKATRNNLKFKIKSCAYKLPRLDSKWLLLKYFHNLPAAPSSTPYRSNSVEKLVKEEEKRSFLEEPTASVHQCAEPQEHNHSAGGGTCH